MKTSRIILVALFALCVSQLTFSQDISLSDNPDITKFNLNRTIKLGNINNLRNPKPSSKVRNIPLKIDKKNAMLFLNIACKVQLGNLTVEVYDPNGEKQGEFSIENHNTFTFTNDNKTQTTAYRKLDSEIVEGNISKNISSPIFGDWVIKLIPKKALAEINIQSQLLFRD
jgi:hypothetical protein